MDSGIFGIVVLVVLENPSSACVLPKVQKPEIKPLEPNEIAPFLKEADKDS